MTHRRSCSLLLYQHSYAQHSAHHRKQEAEPSHAGLTKTNYVSRFVIYFLTRIFLLVDRFVIKSVMSQADFLKERNKYWKLKQRRKKRTAYSGFIVIKIVVFVLHDTSVIYIISNVVLSFILLTDTSSTLCKIHFTNIF